MHLYRFPILLFGSDQSSLAALDAGMFMCFYSDLCTLTDFPSCYLVELAGRLLLAASLGGGGLS